MYKEISEIFLEYVNKKETDYAYLLSGEWGTGKTYFVKNILQKEIKKEVIYISLNGLQDISGIKKKILFDKLSGKIGNIIDNNFIDTVLDLGKSIPFFGIEQISKAADKGKVAIQENIFEKIDLSKTILIFDDLERVSKKISIQEIFGFLLDNFLENKIKVILIGNENEIKDENFESIKEKIIRRTVYFKPSTKELLINFIDNKYKSNNELLQYLKTKIDLLERFFLELNEKNLRTLDFGIESFQKIYSLKEKDKLESIIDDLFINILILTIEYKNGEINQSHLKDKKGLNVINSGFLFSLNNDIKEVEKDYNQKFYEKYIQKYQFPFIFLHSIFDYIITGYLDEKLLLKEVEIKYSEKVNEWDKTYKKIRSFSEFEHKELNDEVTKLISFIKEDKFNILELLNINDFLELIENRNYLECFELDYRNKISEAIERLLKKPKYAFQNFDIHTFNVYQKRISKNVESNNNIIKRIEDEYKKNKFVDINNLISDLLIFANNNTDLFFNQYHQISQNHKIFEQTVRLKTTEFISNLNNRGIYCFQSLISSIIRISNAGDSYYSEKKYLEEMSEKINCILKENTYNHMRKQRLEEFKDDINEAIQHLEKTKK